MVADDTGFWLGGAGGLHFCNPATGAVKTWSRPESTVRGLRLPVNMYGSRIAEETLKQFDQQLRSGLKKVQQEREHIHQAKKNQSESPVPFRLDWRMPGTVIALADDGDFLWIATDTSPGNLMLLHKSSLSLIGCCNVETPISCMVVSDKYVWVGARFGGRLLTRISKETFLSVPKENWLSLAISPDEQSRIINEMNLVARAKYAFYSGDDARVVELLADVNPDKATLEEMFLLGFSYDATGLDQPNRMRYWLDRIMTRYPDSPWAKGAAESFAENEPKHAAREYEESLLARYDRNRNGRLDTNEKAAMENDPAYQEQTRKFKNVQLDFQLRDIIQKFDQNGDNKLDRGELERLGNSVRLYTQVQPEILADRKVVVAPLLSDRFPSTSTILKNYDADKDSLLSVDELKRLAQEIQRRR
jgi:Ca2+-binding EF-hand superfamily protein